MVVLPPFATRFEDTAHADRARYVVEELKKLVDAGGPVLCPILASLDLDLRDLAIELLHENDDGQGGRLYEPRIWAVRLVKGAKPPAVDPQGRPIPEDKKGKVLVVKTGNLGGNAKRSRFEDNRGPSKPDPWRGEARAMKAAAGEDLHATVEIGAKPVRLKSLEHAVIILRRWGVGVQKQRYARPEGWKPGDDKSKGGQDRWLVEEVTESELAKGDADAKPKAA